MIKNPIVSFLISISLLVPSSVWGQEANTYAAQHFKKMAQLAGYGAITTIGTGLALFGAGTALGRYTGTFQKSNRFKFFHKKDTKNREDALLFAGGASAAGMIWYGMRGLKKTIYGQTMKKNKPKKNKTKKLKILLPKVAKRYLIFQSEECG